MVRVSQVSRWSPEGPPLRTGMAPTLYMPMRCWQADRDDTPGPAVARV